MLKGQKALTRCINEFLSQFGVKATLTDDFCYWHHKNFIEYTLFTTAKCTKDFMASVERCNPIVKADEFLWSLLHEVGHHYTMDSIDKDTYEEIWEIKAEIEKGKIPAYKYYDLLDERLATEWAVKYANTHTEELSKFWEKCQDKILKFYLANGVVDE